MPLRTTPQIKITKTKMEYNSQRADLVMPEYGRNVQQMIDLVLKVEDRAERTKQAKAVIKIMTQINPKTKELENYEHKLWDHLHIISGYKLDVDSPFEAPSPKAFETKPENVPYPARNIKYRHYGKTIQDLILKAIDTPEGEQKDAFTLSVANLMKRNYITWNKDSVNDEVIIEHLADLSNGKLTLKDPSKLMSSQEISRSNNAGGKRKRSGGGKGNNRKKRN